ncbi:MAG: hypothetical protein RSG77_05330 [Hafnia sp.]|uniref:hypothetical protein n=1 Tax=Hafnia sp. TaxID=1873498 RepID=UPI002FC6B9D6
MEYVVLTKNNYIDIALHTFIDNIQPRKCCCFIDVDSYMTLKEMTESIKGIKEREKYSYFLISGQSICSKVLRRISSIERNACLSVYKHNIAHGKGKTYAEIVGFIESCQNLEVMTIKEIQLAKLFVKYKTIKKVSIVLNTSQKTLYTRENMMAKKLCLSGSLQLRRFINNEIMLYEINK